MELRLLMSSVHIALNRAVSNVREMKLPRDVLRDARDVNIPRQSRGL
jgi:hypothetical protein